MCSNYGNWLYSAGLGNDPRENRKFNMIKQGLDYDADVSTVGSVIPQDTRPSVQSIRGGIVCFFFSVVWGCIVLSR